MNNVTNNIISNGFGHAICSPGREDFSLRTRAGKVFDVGNGRRQAILFADPVHYHDKNTKRWVEIDNTLEPYENKKGLACFTNKNNGELKVIFAPSSEKSMVLLQNDEKNILAWHLENAQDVSPEKKEKASDYIALKDPQRAVLDRITDEVIYKSILPNTDLICRIESLSFKDEMVFQTPEATQAVSFILQMPGLFPIQSVDGSIDLKTVDGKCPFTLTRPIMKDASGLSIPMAVHSCLEKGASPDEWRLTLSPDPKYLLDAQYPVVLDPAVITRKHSSAIEDNYVTSKQPTTVQDSHSTALFVTYSSNSMGTSRSYIRFLDENLPVIDSSYYVTKAYLNITTKTKPTTAASVYLKEVLGTWDDDTITWNNAPALADKAIDYAYMTAVDTKYEYDISNLVRKWYTGFNYGFALESITGTYMALYSSNYVYAKPYVTINYISLAGLEDYLLYENQDLGRAGIGHVSLYNGNLIFERQDTLCSGKRMPVSVSHVYNSCYRNDNVFGCGYGWKTNFHQTLHLETLPDSSGNVTYYVYMDADGTRHHFKLVSGTWKDQSGLGMVLTITGSTVVIEDKGHNTLFFDLPTVEFNGDYSNAKLLRSASDACGNTITLTASGFIINNIEDGSGRNTGFSYNDSLLETLLPPGYGEDGYSVFSYSNGSLTGCCELSENSVYEYDENGLLISVTDNNGRTVHYEYTSTHEPYRVNRVWMNGGALTAFDRSYEYKDCLTIVEDHLTGKKIYYHFNDYGNCVSVNDELGYARCVQYSDNNPVNHPAAVSKLQHSIVNLINYHNFEAGTGWTTTSLGATGSYSYATDQKFMGSKSMKVNKTNSDGSMSVSMTFNGFEEGKDYTFSGYIRSTGNAQCHIRYSCDSDETNTVPEAPGVEWKRISGSFTARSTSGTVSFVVTGGPGVVWIDCAQLEVGPVVNRYNLLINGDFNLNSGAQPTGWEKNSSNAAVDIVYDSYTGNKPADLSSNTMRMYGAGRTKYPGIHQDIVLSGHQGDVFVAGGWSMNYSKPRKGENFRYNIRVAFLKSGTSSTWQNAPSVEWSEEWTDWQFVAGPIIAPCNYSKVRFSVDYERNINYAEFGGLFLHKEEFGQSFIYDSTGNILTSTNASGSQDGARYDLHNNLVSYFQPGRSASEQVTFEWGNTDTEKKKHLLRKSTSPLGIVNEYNYDSNGNLLTSNTNDGTEFMETHTTYDANGRHITA